MELNWFKQWALKQAFGTKRGQRLAEFAQTKLDDLIHSIETGDYIGATAYLKDLRDAFKGDK